MNTETNQQPLTKLFEHVETYFKTTSEMLKLQAVQKSSDSIAGIIAVLVLGILFLHFFIFLNLGIAIWVSNLLNSFTMGFLFFSGFYAVLFVLLYYKREDWIINPIKEKISADALEQFDANVAESVDINDKNISYK